MSADRQPITFYDIPGSASPKKAWSPNCWKARYVLNMKKLPYKTIWLEYPEIETEMKRLGIAPTGKRGERDLYTLPAIVDPNTGTALADSYAIALYLERTYPTSDTPILFPRGTRALQLGFRDTFNARVRGTHLYYILALPNVQQMNPSSSAYWRQTREEMIGSPLEELAPPGDKRAARTRGVLDGLHAIGTWLDANTDAEDGEDGGPFVTGAQPCFTDLEIAANLLWLRIVGGDGEDSLWTAVAKADGERWARYAHEFEKWESVA